MQHSQAMTAMKEGLVLSIWGGQLHLQQDGRTIDFRLTHFDSIIQQHLYASLPLAAWLVLRLLHLAARQKRFGAGALEDIVLSSHDEYILHSACRPLGVTAS